MAAKKFLDYDGLIHLWQQIKSAFSNTIETIKVDGTALTPDSNKAVNISTATTSAAGLMSSDDKTKLNGIESGAEANDIDGITVNGNAVTVTNKIAAISISIPTVPTTVSSFTNDAGYLTASDITQISYEIVSSYADLPSTGAVGKIYLVPNSGSQGNSYDEYIWVTSGSGAGATSSYEKIGTTAVDLSHYWKDNGTDSNSLIAMNNTDIAAAITAANQSA